MRKPTLLIADAPGGPHPTFYLPSLLAEFEVHVVWLDREPQAPRQARVDALEAVTDAGGHVIAVPEPAAFPEALTKAVAQTGADGVLAFSERVVHMAQLVAWEAGLPANPPAALKKLQDKELQRKALAAGGLATPRVWPLRTSEDVERAVRTAHFAAVLKPAVGMGSIAVFRIETAHQLIPVWQQARGLVDADIRISHHSPVLLLEEELVGDPGAAHDGLGDYLSVEAMVINAEA
jgi:biotin carboxylase